MLPTVYRDSQISPYMADSEVIFTAPKQIEISTVNLQPQKMEGSGGVLLRATLSQDTQNLEI